MNWSDRAETILEDALAAAARKARDEGADGAEVADDLRRRVEQELAARNVAVVSSADVEAVLAALGVPLADAAPAAESPSPDLPRQEPKNSGCMVRFGSALTWFVPGVALMWELVARLSSSDMPSCKSLFFDPIPTWLHAVLVALVPVVNFLGWRGRFMELPPGARAAARYLWGAALAAGIWFGIRFAGIIPLAMIGLVGIIYFGLGLIALLPLSPYIGLAGLAAFRDRFDEPGGGRQKLGGFAIAAVLLFALYSRSLVTNHALSLATSDDPAGRARGVQLLRTWADRGELAGLCFGAGEVAREFGGGFDPLGSALTGVSAEEAQQIFYRVYGAPFFTTTTTGRRMGLRGEPRRVEVAFDTGQGGDNVGQNVTGLSLVESRMDGQIESDLAVSYLEWTLVFRNSASVQREARAQIALPPGAVVSRLTLWVDGEEREAAFSGNSQVKAAYKKVVQVLRRDPVLVTSRGQDRVMMQCYPVPPDGGTMKVRLGITVPMALPADETAVFSLPVFIERNFALRGLASHDVWLQCGHPIDAGGTGWAAKTNAAGNVSRHAALAPSATLNGAGLIRVARNPAATVLASRDPIDSSGTIVTRIAAVTSAPPARVVLALDASSGMGETIRAALTALPAEWKGVELAAVIATHETTRTLEPRAWDAAGRAAVEELVQGARFEGGQDNAPALTAAWDIASQSPRGVVLWLHGPCPETISQPGALRQRMERSASGPELHDIQLVAGPNRLVENLEALPGCHSHGAAGGGDALRQLIARHRDPATRDAYRTRENPQAPAGAVVCDSPHPARLWANARVNDLLAKHTPDESAAAASLAARYYLVTPVSGAVVLETKQQFEDAGLTAAPSSVVTIVPEPATLLLALTGIAALLLFRFVRRRLAIRA